MMIFSLAFSPEGDLRHEGFPSLSAHLGRDVGSLPARRHSAFAALNCRFRTRLPALERLGASNEAVPEEGRILRSRAEFRRSAGCSICSQIESVGDQSFLFTPRVAPASDRLQEKPRSYDCPLSR